MKQIQNNKEEVPFEHYAKAFRQLNPQEAAQRCKVKFDEATGLFTLRLFGKPYQIRWPEYEISGQEGSLALRSLPAQTFLLRYLLEGKAVGFTGQWKTFREMPWGEMYIQPYTGRCLTRAAFTFGTRLDQFQTACEKLGALRLSHGDAAYQLPVLDGYEMQIIVWEGDDEFPPNSQILFSDNFSEVFAAEDRVVCCDILISVVKSLM